MYLRISFKIWDLLSILLFLIIFYVEVWYTKHTVSKCYFGTEIVQHLKNWNWDLLCRVFLFKMCFLKHFFVHKTHHELYMLYQLQTITDKNKIKIPIFKNETKFSFSYSVLIIPKILLIEWVENNYWPSISFWKLT